MEEIEFKVCDKDTGKVVGYEFFNTHYVGNGYYCLDLSELEEGMEIGDLSCHSNTDTLKPSHPLGRLVRYRYTGYNDNQGKKIYLGDTIEIKPFISSRQEIVSELTVAFWLINPLTDMSSITLV